MIVNNRLLSLLLTVTALGALAIVLGLWWASPSASSRVQTAGPQPSEAGAALEQTEDSSRRSQLPSEDSSSARDSGRGAERAATVVSGTVVLASGSPVADALVLCGPAGPTFVGFLNSALRHVPREVPGYRYARTDERGRFELEPDSLQALRVTVLAAHCVQFDLAPVYAQVGRKRDLGALTLQEGVILTGSVIDSRDIPVARAEIHRFEVVVRGLADQATRVLAGRSGADGRFELRPIPPGSWLFQVDAEGYPELFVTGKSTTPGADPGHVFRLPWGDEISGSVTGLDGEDPATVVVRAVHRGDPQMIGTLTGFVERQALCDAEGRFALTRLPGTPGTPYDLHAGFSAGGVYWNLSEPVTAHPGDREVRIALTPTARLDFRVVDGDTGERVDDAQVVLGHPSGTLMVDSSRRDTATIAVLSRLQDRYQIRRIPTGRPAMVLLAISSPRHATTLIRSFPLRGGELTDLGTIVLEPRDALRVHVLDGQTSEPIESATVYLRCPRAGEPDPSRQTTGPSRTVYSPELRLALTDAQGMAVLPMPEGCSSVVAADHPDYAPSDPRPVDHASARAAPLKLHLDRGGAAEILVVDRTGVPVPGATVRRRPDDTLHRIYRDLVRISALERIATGPDGIARFSALPPGVHRFELESRWRSGPSAEETDATESDSHALLSVAAGAPASATLVLEVGSGVRGVLTECGVPLVGAELFLVDRSLLDIGLGQHASVDQSYGPMGRRPIAVSGLHGRFDIARAPVGDWQLEIHHPDRVLAMRREVSVGADGAEWLIDLPRPGLTGVLLGPREVVRSFPFVYLVLAEFRARVMAALDRESLLSKERELAHGILAETRPDHQGRFRFAGVPDGVPLFAVAFGESGAAVESATFTLDADESHPEILLEIVDGGSVLVELTGWRADTVYFVALQAADDEQNVRQKYADRRGQARFDHLAEGSWRVSVVEGISSKPILEGSIEVSRDRIARVVLHLP